MRVVVGILALLLAACGGQPTAAPATVLAKDQVVGRWQEGSGSQDPTLLLHPDLGFQVFNWPVQAFAGVGDPAASVTTRIDGSGRWNLVGPPGEQAVILRWQQAGSLGAPPPDSGRLVAGPPPRLRFRFGDGRSEVVQLEYTGSLSGE